jgi:alanine racemase
LSSNHRNQEITQKGPEISGPFLQPEFSIQNPNCWIELSRCAFNDNCCAIKKLIGSEVGIAAVIKSNAYGHGLVPMAHLCQEQPQVTYIVVFLLSDALLLRSIGITKPILVLGGYDCSLELAIEQHIDITVHNDELVEFVDKKSRELQSPVRVHIKVDSGLARLGFNSEQAVHVVEKLRANRFVQIMGLYTHFAESDADDTSFTDIQCARFAHLNQQLVAQGISISYVHAANTAATLRFPATHFTMIRCGGLLYGTYKHDQFYKAAQERNAEFELQPLLTLKARVLAIKEVPAQTPVGYARTCITARHTRLAVVSLGYFDGYDRRLSNNSVMIIRGQPVPVVGRIAMNMVTLDVTDVPHVSLGEEVAVIGNNDGIRARDLAGRIGGIEYEIYVRLGAHIERRIV